MTDIDHGWARLCAESDARAKLTTEAFATNKPTLFAALAAAGVHLVTVRFDGAGDSGQIESIETYDAANRTIALLDEPIGVRAPADDLSGLVDTISSVHQVIEEMVYDLLRQTCGGWELDDGAYGEFAFDVATRAVKLEYHERRMDEDYSEHLF